MASSKAKRRREMIRKRSTTLFRKGYQLHTKTSVQVAVITYDEIRNAYRVFRTSERFIAAIKRECPLVEDLVAGFTIFANNEATYQEEESNAESDEEEMLITDLRDELEDVNLEYDQLQTQEQDSPPPESEVLQEQQLGHNTGVDESNSELISQGAVLMEDSGMVLEEHVIYNEIAESEEQRPADESGNHWGQPPATVFDPLILQPLVGNQRDIKETGLEFLREPPLWSGGETNTVHSILQTPPTWEAA